MNLQTIQNIVDKLVKESGYCNSHYYGNYDNYSIKYVVLSELYKFLEKLD